MGPAPDWVSLRHSRHRFAAAGDAADRALRLALADALATVEHVQAQVSRGYVRGRNAAPEWLTPLAAELAPGGAHHTLAPDDVEGAPPCG